ncbi:MAG TPA: carboxypeptidase-like regulatory domain-containing protein [Acidimicrobiales bacterium]
MNWLRAGSALAAALLLAAGCSHVNTLSYPIPPSIPATAPPTTLGNLAGIQMATVAGAAATPVAIGPGEASLTGIITGPSGPVVGADIHAERLVGNDVASTDALSQADGTWTISGILGGRYRVRAWRAPDLALTDPQIFFLPDSGDRSVSLHLDQFDAGAATTAINPDAPVAGQPAGLAVLVTGQSVDAQGVVRLQPVAGASVELAGGLSWTVLTANPATTSAGGRATWQVMCDAPGPQALAVIVDNTDVYPLDLPACAAPVSPTSTTAPPPSDTTTTSTGPTGPTVSTAPSTSTAPTTSTTVGKPASTTSVPRRR